MKPQPELVQGKRWEWKRPGWSAAWVDGSDPASLLIDAKRHPGDKPRSLCPYGKPGDRLWVREAWYYEEGVWDIVDGGKEWDPDVLCYATDMCYVTLDHFSREKTYYREPWPDEPWFTDGKRHSIYMPRWASRITLEITNVRVERVQEISEDDIDTEGINSEWYLIPYGAKAGFKATWNLSNEKKGFGWDENPWVWILEFQQVVGE